ncbi:MAG: transcriptional regulator [Polaromonas sp.]|nr:transcriptional regulator [Polaromonas sp.]
MPRLKPNISMCSAARSLELLGDRWTLLLIREVVFGTRRFDDFAAHLGIARNVLSVKLTSLVQAGILVQRPLKQDAKRLGYHLTDMGQALLPVLVALVQWGDRWLQTPDSVPVRFIERATGEELAPIRLRNAAGKEVSLRELDWAPGPGADHPSIAPLVAAYEGQRRVVLRPLPQAVTGASTTVQKP